MLCGLALALPLALVSPPQDDTDLLTLTDGKEIECRVLYEDDDVVVARVKRREREYPRADVAEVRSIERSLQEFLDRFEKIDAQDSAALGELALFCEANDLPGEARNLWIRILTVDPENERAWTKLGGSHGRKGWRLKVRGRYYTLDQLRERTSDWKNALELRTAHFLLMTDVAPERALDVAIDLERAYLTFYGALAPHLRLYAFDEVPEVHVFSSLDDYPTPPTPRDAWFSLSANTVYVNGSEGRNPYEIVQNFTYLLFFNAFHRTLGKTGSIAPWARNGLAQMFGIAVRPDPGRVRWDFEMPYRPYFESLARDEDPLSLEDVLRSNRLSFEGNRDAERYSAAGYCLTYFLIYADERANRAAFAEFLLSSFEGQGSAKHFERILGRDLEEIEAEWMAFVRGQAGG